MQPAALAQGHQLLDDRAQVLGLRQRGDDLLVLDQRGDHIAEHGAAMFRRAVELAMDFPVAHGSSPYLFLVITGLVPVIPLRRVVHSSSRWPGEPGHDKGGD